MTDFESLRQQRASGHPSRRDLEALAFGAENDRPGVHDARRHVESGCDACSATVERLKQERVAFLARRPVKPFVARVSGRVRSPFWKRWSWAGGIGAALVAASVAVWVVVAPSSRDDESNPIRLKGSAPLRLEVLVSRGGETAFPLAPGSSLREGDVLRFHVNAPADGYVAVFNLDGEGRVERYFPSARGEPGRIFAGAQLLPGSVELDGFAGEERITLFWSQSPLDEAVVERALQDAYRQAAGLPRGPLEFPGESTSVFLRKAAR